MWFESRTSHKLLADLPNDVSLTSKKMHMALLRNTMKRAKLVEPITIVLGNKSEIVLGKNVVLHYLHRHNKDYCFGIKQYLIRKKLYSESSGVVLSENEFKWIEEKK